jgi:phage-related baseplate assembly protein
MVQTFDVAIPAGTRVGTRDGKQIFITISACMITSGQTEVDIGAVSETAGEIANGYAIGEVSNQLDPIQYVDSVSNLTITSAGAEEESDDRLRQRIKEAPESYSTAGPDGAYIFWTKSAHQDIADVAVTSPSPGEVNVYPLTLAGTPSEEILALVTGVLNGKKVRPLTDHVNVLSPAAVDFVITADITLFASADTPTVQSQVATNIAAYDAAMRAVLGKDIVPSQIIALINAVEGVYKVVLASPELHELAAGEWANCTEITLNYVGYANG